MNKICQKWPHRYVVSVEVLAKTCRKEGLSTMKLQRKRYSLTHQAQCPVGPEDLAHIVLRLHVSGKGRHNLKQESEDMARAHTHTPQAFAALCLASSLRSGGLSVLYSRKEMYLEIVFLFFLFYFLVAGRDEAGRPVGSKWRLPLVGIACATVGHYYVVLSSWAEESIKQPHSLSSPPRLLAVVSCQ